MSELSRVKLKTFQGMLKSASPVDENEDFWKLIGKTGQVLEDMDGNTVMVLFDDNLDDYGLENHNPVKNSLMIKKSDLQYLTD